MIFHGLGSLQGNARTHPTPALKREHPSQRLLAPTIRLGHSIAPGPLHPPLKIFFHSCARFQGAVRKGGWT
jgi:hypothetical protein